MTRPSCSSATAFGIALAPVSGLRTERRLLLAWRERAQLSGPAEALVRMVEKIGDGAVM